MILIHIPSPVKTLKMFSNHLRLFELTCGCVSTRPQAHHSANLQGRLRACWAVLLQITRLRSDLAGAVRGRAEAVAIAEASGAVAVAPTSMQSTAVTSPAGDAIEVSLIQQADVSSSGPCVIMPRAWLWPCQRVVPALQTGAGHGKASLKLPASALAPSQPCTSRST